jgi:hypothetical protein
VARVDHSFAMREPPAAARRRLEEELGWELRRKRGFALVSQEPLRLGYSDGGSGTWAFAGRPRRLGLYRRLRELTARRVEISLAAEGEGTRVRVRGHADRALCRSLERLGTPGRWPETRMQLGAPAGIGEEPPPQLSPLPFRPRKRR